MLEIKCEIDLSLADAIEIYGCDQVDVSPWTVIREKPEDPYVLFGYFTTVDERDSAWNELNKAIKGLPKEPIMGEIDDLNWKERYKDFLDVWEHNGLAWVPVWKRNVISTTEKVRVLYDAGMAFGTGDHPTTQLCAQRLMEFGKRHAAQFHMARIIDAGCGSGILALSASKLGCSNIYAFDHDPEAITVSKNNLVLNDMDEKTVDFQIAGIEDGLKDQKAHLIMANIQSDVLSIYADNFAEAIHEKGTLILSGILDHEKDDVEQRFRVAMDQANKKIKSVASRTSGDWADICFRMA